MSPQGDEPAKAMAQKAEQDPVSIILLLDGFVHRTVRSGGGGDGGVPVVDGHTGETIATAYPDPVTGILTYNAGRTMVVQESSGGTTDAGTAGSGGWPAPVRVIVDSTVGAGEPSPPPEHTREDFSGPGPTVDRVRFSEPRRGVDGDARYCFTKPDHGRPVYLRPQELYNPRNVGDSYVWVIFADANGNYLQTVALGAGLSNPARLAPPPGTAYIAVTTTEGEEERSPELRFDDIIA